MKPFQQLEFSEPYPDSPFVFYSPPTPTSFGEGPERLDLLDRVQAELAPSSIPNSGAGVFAKVDIPENVAATIFTAMMLRNGRESMEYDDK